MRANKIVSAIGLLVFLLKPNVITDRQVPPQEMNQEETQQESLDHALIMCRLQINTSSY